MSCRSKRGTVHNEHIFCTITFVILNETEHTKNKMKTTKTKNCLVVDNVSLKMKHNAILSNISMTAQSGRVFAFMGQTGSGKTTFLNVIAGRQTPDEGSIKVNGEVFDKRMRRKMAFVQQHDVFFSQLTLKETLVFTVSLRMPEDIPKSEKLEVIDGIVKSLHLEKCLNTVIGDIFTKGLSGGEKKRASIACELLSNPDFILLDEPTSGLDSSSAQNIIEVLKQLASQHNRLVVLSIHQPSSNIYNMFDDLLILSEGRTVYNGRREDVIPFFTEMGVVFKPSYNPADLILDHVTNCDEILHNVSISKANGHAKVGIGTTSGIQPQSVPLERDEEKWQTSWWTQYKVLSVRSLKQSFRVLMQGYSTVLAITTAVITSLFYFQVGVSLKTLRDVYGLIFFHIGNWTFLPGLGALGTFGDEYRVVVKERASGAYRLSAYFFARITSELPEAIILPGIMWALIYWTGGLGGPREFFISLMIVYAQTFACSGFGLFMAVTCRDARMAITTIFTYFITSYVTGGFFSQNPPYWIGWLRYCSILYYPYAFTLTYMIPAKLSDIPCNSSLADTFPRCWENTTSFVTSSDILEQEHIYWPSYIYAIVVLSYTAVLRVAAYVVFRIRNEKIV